MANYLVGLKQTDTSLGGTFSLFNVYADNDVAITGNNNDPIYRTTDKWHLHADYVGALLLNYFPLEVEMEPRKSIVLPLIIP